MIKPNKNGDRVNPRPRQRKLAQLLYERMSNDAMMELTDKKLCKMAGYNSNKPTTEIVRSIGVQQELQQYIKQNKKVEERLRAKMLRNLDDGLDDDNPIQKLAYTQLQAKRVESENKQASTVTINTENVNMMTLLGLTSKVVPLDSGEEDD